MSPLYNYFKNAYDDGKSAVTTKDTLKNAATKAYITADEYQLITGEAYVV